MKIVFMGTPDFAVSSLDAILQAGYEVAAVVTVPDRPAGRGQKMSISAVKAYAQQHNLPILQPEKLRDTDFQNTLLQIDADLFVVVAFRMLPQSVWSMPKIGTFNLHASLLPQYRGAAPINWAIINGEKVSGVSTFFLNEHIDEGAILLQKSTPISDDDTAETLHDRLALLGKDLVIETIQGLEKGTLIPSPQTIEKETILKPAPKIFKSDCAINWNWNGDRIYNFVRGLSPYPATTMQMTTQTGDPLFFKVYEVAFEQAAGSTIGKVYSDGKNYLKIGIADGYIHILSLQASGKKRNDITNFLRGFNVNNYTSVI